MPNHLPRAILIAGPTASGKSELALALAERLAGVVINADSMQVYRDLAVLTARPGPADEARAPHRLYGHVDGAEAYSAGRFVREAAAEIAAAEAAHRLPIVVGGTGLYFKALIEGLSPMPEIPPPVRAHWRSQARRLGAEALHRQLAARDPVMAARLRPTDPQRIVRALEVLDASGRSLADWQAAPRVPVIAEAETVRLRIACPREELHARAEARFARMLEQGAVAEIEALAARNLSPDLPVMRAIGVRPLLDLISGATTRQQALSDGQAETRRYIKRQETWLARNMITWKEMSTKEKNLNDQVLNHFI